VASRRILTKIGLHEGPEFLVEGLPCVWFEANAPQPSSK
jgi:hypothetical protein